MAAQQFSWAAGMDAGLGLLQGFGSFMQAQGANEVAEANAAATQMVREANNKVRAANSSLAATMRGINTKRVMEAAGKQYNALATSAARQQDAFAVGNFEQGIRDSEAQGALLAQSAASGVGGTALGALSFSQQLQQGRLRYRTMKQQGQVSYDVAMQMAGVMSSAEGSLDRSPISAGFDLSRQGYQQQSGNIVSYLTAGLLGKSDSLQTLLGSIKQFDQQAAATEAVSSPVYRGAVNGTDLAPFTSTPTIAVNNLSPV